MEDNITCWCSIKTIDKRIQAFKEGYRQNLALLGDSTRINYILNNSLLKYSNDGLVLIYINLSYIGEKELFSNVAYSILSEYFKKDEPLDSLLYLASDILPLTTSFIKNILKTNNFISFIKILELINKFINETLKECILVIDEFTELKKMFKNFSQDFSRFIIFQKKCMLIITSSNINMAKTILSSELNFLFGNFEHIYLMENIFLENYFYFKNSLKPIEPSCMFLSFFLNITGENITYYDILVEEIRKYYTYKEKECIKEVIKNILLKEESYFFQRFIAYVNIIKEKFKEYSAVLKLLLNISKGYIRKREIISLNIPKIKNITRVLNKLIELDYIVNHGDIYKIKDDLFSFWLSHIFCYYFYPIILDTKRKKAIFMSHLNDTIETFNTIYLKDKTERIIDLINTFNNDHLKINNQRLKLPQINRIKTISEPSRKLSFLVGEGKEIIFIGIKKESAEDSDILYYLEKSHIFRSRNIKKIFITLYGFSTSAQIIAKENKLIVWDVNDINKLLKVYCKPLIVNEDIGNFRYSYTDNKR